MSYCECFLASRLFNILIESPSRIRLAWLDTSIEARLSALGLCAPVGRMHLDWSLNEQVLNVL